MKSEKPDKVEPTPKVESPQRGTVWELAYCEDSAPWNVPNPEPEPIKEKDKKKP